MIDIVESRGLTIKLVPLETLRGLKIISAQETMKLADVIAMLVDLYNAEDSEFLQEEE